MGVAVVGDRVGSDRDRGVGLVDVVVDGARGVVVVAAGVGERPGVRRVVAGGGVGRARLVEAGEVGRCVGAGGRAAAAGGVRAAVVRVGVAGDRGVDGVGLGDVVRHGGRGVG